MLSCALAYGVFVPVFQSNDDVALEMIASGRGICPQPTPFLLFINVLLGDVLSWLYANLSGAPWYRVFMFGLHLAAGLTLAGLAVSRGASAARLILAVNFFLVFDLYFWVRPHFSIAAVIPALAAVILWFDATSRGRFGCPTFVLFIALVCASVLVRFEATLQMLLVAAPNLLLAGIRPAGENSWRRLVRLGVVPAAAVAFILVGAKAYNDHRYATTPGWEDFYEYNALRAELTDYQRATYDESTKPVFDRVGWSQNDFFLLLAWFFPDDKRYSADAFRTVLDAFPRVDSAGSAEVLSGLWSDVRASAALRALLVSVVVPFAFVRWRGSGWTSLVVAVGASVLVGGLVVMVRRRLPPWVYEPLLAFGPALALVLPTAGGPDAPTGRARKVGQVAALAVLVFSAIAGALELRQQSETALLMNGRLKQAVRQLAPRPDQLYVVWGGLFPFEFLLSGADLEQIRDFKMLATGFTAHTPINKARLQQFGIDDICQALYRRPDVFLICHEYYVPYLAAYVRDHDGRDIAGDRLAAVAFGPWPQFDGNRGHMMAYPRGFSVVRLKERPSNPVPAGATAVSPPQSHAPF